jgi:hypothetical protein
MTWTHPDTPEQCRENARRGDLAVREQGIAALWCFAWCLFFLTVVLVLP